MKTTRHKLFAAVLILMVAVLVIAGTKVSKLTSTRTIDTNSLFIVVTGTTVKVTKQIPEQDLMTNLMHITHFRSDGWFWITNRRVVIITNGLTGQFLTYSNGVPQWVDVTPGGGGGSGDVTTAQLLNESNVLRSLTIANDTITSNGLTGVLVANDTTTSNGVLTASRASDIVTSNGLSAIFVANDTTTSNGVLTASRASDITTSNGAVSFAMTASNSIRGAVIANSSGRGTNTTLFGSTQLGDGDSGGTTTTSNNLSIKASATLQSGSTLSFQDGTANRALYLTAGKVMATSPGVDASELEYLDGVTGGIQTNVTARLPNNGGLGTNETFRGVTLPSLTASRAAVVDASGNLTNAIGTPDGTKFLRDDNTYAVPASGGTVAWRTNNTAAGSENIANYTNNLEFLWIVNDVGASTRVDIEARLQNDAVTFAKMQNITSDRILGRDTAGSGDIEELALDGTSLEFNGSGTLRRSALAGDVTASAGSATTTIAANAVTDTKLRDSAGVSLIGRSANSTGDPADIVASGNGYVYWRSNGAVVAARFNFTNDSVANLSLANVQPGDVLAFHDSTGLITNKAIIAAPFLLRGTNLWFDGGASLLYSNHSLTAIAGGLTNMIPTNILDNTEVHLWFNAGIGLTVNFPASSASEYVPDNAVVSPNTNCMTHVIFSRRGTTTNISVLTAGLTLSAGNFTEASTNYATRVIAYQNTTRTTNYATGALTINCATDVRANITNAVASNYAITLATPVLYTVGSLSLVSDAGAGRTLAILSPSASITWMSTNYTANATNILTTTSKRSLFSWRVQLATDGSSTNIACWNYNQF